ncbi:endonuclease [Rubrivirga marina]|uniref:endonuclease n=1 Tax=Rubrivirga marina TaxID=1196024 RepID=UPI000BA8E400|nr:endonuclease [Rubrivirga marina]
MSGALGMSGRAWGRAATLGLWTVALAACGGDGAQTAGPFRDDGVSTAGSFDDSARLGTEADAPAAVDGGLFPGLGAEALAAAIDRDYSPTGTLGYTRARDVLYAHEQETTGTLCGVYSAYCVTLPPGDPSAEAMRLEINAEHVWPQSMGARTEPLKSDLHHLFPARQTVNSSRGNLPFGEIDDEDSDAWYLRDQSQSRPPDAERDAWAERGAGRFEPPEPKKGDVARAVFYVAAVYPELAEPSFFRAMEADLLTWNRLDPPDAGERARSAWVASLQGTENPFVLDPSLADRLWGGGGQTPTGGSQLGASAPPASAPRPGESRGPLRITEIHYDNAGEDAGEGVEVAGPPGTSLDGWRLVLYNGNGGRVYDEVALAGALPASGAVWADTPGLQNGSPDGVALVGPDGAVAELLSYEGAFEGTDGPAFGLRSMDLGAAEGPDTPRGQSLQRTAGGWRLAPATPGR